MKPGCGAVAVLSDDARQAQVASGDAFAAPGYQNRRYRPVSLPEAARALIDQQGTRATYTATESLSPAQPPHGPTSTSSVNVGRSACCACKGGCVTGGRNGAECFFQANCSGPALWPIVLPENLTFVGTYSPRRRHSRAAAT
jgi:hypothetical protein